MTASSLPSDRFQQPARSRYRPDIDGLRAVAVIAVIVNHFNKEWLPSGFLGVDIFFVISGYVITSSLYGHRSESLSHFLLGFYGRRVKRLVPALIACVLLTSIVMGMVNPSPGVSLQTGIAALFGVSNLFLYNLSVDYFAPLTELNAFTHTWSLGVEEQFYLLFPLLFWFSGVAQKRQSAKRTLAFIIGGFSLFSFIGFVSNSFSNPSAAYFLMPWRFWEMGAGVLLYILVDGWRLSRFSLHGLLPICFVGFLFLIFTLPASQRAISTPLAVLISSLLIAGLKPGQSAHRVLSWRPIVSVGLISYSLYLWHWSVLVISRYTTGVHRWTTPFQIAIIIVLSILSYVFIETPLRRSSWKGSDASNILTGLASLAIASGFLIAIAILPGFSLYTGNKNAPQMVGQPGLASPYLPQGVSGRGWRGKPCLLESNADVGKTINPVECHFGNALTPAGKIQVIGDSFAPSFVSAFDDLIAKDRFQVSLVASYGASPVPEVSNNGNQQKANQYFWSRIVPQQIARLKSGDTLLLINDLEKFSPPKRDPSSDLKLVQYKKGLQKLVRELKPKGIDVAVLSSLPFAREANCVPEVARREWFNAFGGPCQFLSKKETLRRSQPLREVLAELARQKEIVLIDPMPIFCAGDTCTYANAEEGIVLYRDSNSHPSVEAARLTGQLIRKELISLRRD